MKPREARRSVMIRARMRHGAAWNDARILNISSRGLLVHAPETPRRGAYVEICKGQHRIIARVVWTQDERFGVHTQDRLSIDSITTGVEPPATATGTVERRSRPRGNSAAERHARSRRQSRTIEFLCVAALGIAAAAFAFDAIDQTLSRPLAQISKRLDSGG